MVSVEAARSCWARAHRAVLHCASITTARPCCWARALYVRIHHVFTSMTCTRLCAGTPRQSYAQSDLCLV